MVEEDRKQVSIMNDRTVEAGSEGQVSAGVVASDSEMITKLRDARAAVDKHEALIHAEMDERGRDGELWTNEQCAAWTDYETALSELKMLRREFGT